MNTSEAHPVVHLFALGDARIETPGDSLEPTSAVAFTVALYLLLERAEPVARKTLEALLWPEAPAKAASHRLRQTLLKLKSHGFPIEAAGKTKLTLGDAEVSIDFEEFLVSRKGLDRPSDEALILLPGYNPLFSAPVMEWLDKKKAEVNSSITRLMLGIVARHRVMAQWSEVERNARKLLGVSPYNEEATLALAEAYAMRGSKLEGMRILDTYLSEVGRGPTDLRVPATIMRKRIADRIPPRAHLFAANTPLVGRSAAMEELGVLLDRARAREGQACLIWGDAGIGKSRLLAEFSTFAALQGVRAQRVQCRASDPHRPLSVFVDLVPSLRGMRGAIGCSPETMSYLDRLTKHRPTPIEVKAEEGDSEFVYARVQMALFDLIDAVSEETPLMIVVEDVHWLDSTSATVLRDLIAWVADHPIIFVFTGRERPEQWMPNMPGNLREIHLPPLQPEPSADVVLGILRQYGKEVSATYLSWCVDVAEGNPYFLEELANHWIETGAEHEVPPSLTAMLDQRVSRLDADALQLLQTCAILEKNSTLERIERVLEYQSHQLLRAINTLGTAGMVITEHADSPAHGPDRIVSRHDLLSNAALTLLPPPARAFLHRRAGAVLEEEIDADRSAAILWDCAKHWQLSGNTARAFALASSCATHLMKVGLPIAAAEAYEKCLAFCSDDRERLEMLLAQASAYFKGSAWSEVEAVASKARQIKLRLDPSASPHDELELMELRARWRTLDWHVIRDTALSCLKTRDASAPHRVEAGVMGLMLLSFGVEHAAMTAAYAEMENLFTEPDVTAASKLQAKMVFHTDCGDLQEAVISARLLVARHHSEGNDGDEFRARCNAAVTFRVAGLFDEATSSLEEALRLADIHNLLYSKVRALPMLAHLALERGRNEEARRWFVALSNIPPRDGDKYTRLDLDGIAVRLALLDGNLAEAKRALPMSLSEACSDPIPYRRTYLCALHVVTQLASKRGVSRKLLIALEDAHARSRIGLHQAFASYALFAALCGAGEEKKAHTLRHEYETRYRREPWPAPTHLLDSILKFA